ncbi:ATV_HP_G0008360.mRNA.1.CDS.1 [Saccharomyces cerevisiae]|nr:ATV_HP_G0008360.mRNA.1.CDS.1 [Saccharomyces cerevisiae]CAI6941625.1 ATV_HP_G0008360.mRNA.1.CDS.1 [Saccharomyces cerevisiae]
MTGASFLGSEYREQISDPICGPLRWIIFSHADFQPPSKTYIIQSLLLVEGYEKTSTNRYLHERSFLHHGTTIQLLRRTPSLGGHPLMVKTGKTSGENSIQDPQEVYKRWIDFEMLKRVTFYAFIWTLHML